MSGDTGDLIIERFEEHMTKQEIKDLCEDDPKLQWWAMVLFVEISEVAHNGYGYGPDDRVLAEFVHAKVDEFPRLIIQRAQEKVKERAAALKAER